MSKRLQGELLLLFITAVWGASFSLMRNVLGLMPFFAYTAIRFDIAAVALLIIFRKKLKNINREHLRYGSIVGLFLFAGMYLQVLGLCYTTASNSAFITGLNVVMVPIMVAVVNMKRPETSSVVGVTLAFAGLFFLCGGVRMNFNFGDFITFLCAICFALQIIVIDRYTTRYDPVLIGVIQVISAAVLFNVLWAVTGIKPFTLNFEAVSILFVTGFFGTALAFLGQTVVQKHSTPTRTALIITVEPVFGAIFATIIPDITGKTDSLTLFSLIGCLLILGGMFAVEVPMRKLIGLFKK